MGELQMETTAIRCRLCGGVANLHFSRRAADGDEVKTYRCTSCQSLQTEEPHWLKEVYGPALEEAGLNLDTYAVERSLRCRIAVCFLWKLGAFSTTRDKLLDWGGGPGLLVRLLRDVGIDAYNHEKYVANHFAAGFSRSDEHRYAFVTSFEAFEHFVNPETDLDLIFALRPSFLLITTGIYKNQGPDWPYLGPPKSGHVFFYSEEALKYIGRRYSYQMLRLHDMTLFVNRPIAKWRIELVRLLLGNPHLAEIVFALKRKWSLSAIDNQRIFRENPAKTE